MYGHHEFSYSLPLLVMHLVASQGSKGKRRKWICIEIHSVEEGMSWDTGIGAEVAQGGLEEASRLIFSLDEFVNQ